MGIQVFFNRPKSSINLDMLLRDITYAKNRLGIASAWFTNDQIARCVINNASAGLSKIVVLSRSDLKRDAKNKAYDLIRVSGSTSIGILGGEDYRQGTMHHKFIVTDNTVWTGSYNYTYQARVNYENLVRIDDVHVANQYWQELESMFTSSQRMVCNHHFCDCAAHYGEVIAPQIGNSGRYRCAQCSSDVEMDVTVWHDDDYGGVQHDYCRRCVLRCKPMSTLHRHMSYQFQHWFDTLVFVFKKDVHRYAPPKLTAFDAVFVIYKEIMPDAVQRAIILGCRDEFGTTNVHFCTVHEYNELNGFTEYQSA